VEHPLTGAGKVNDGVEISHGVTARQAAVQIRVRWIADGVKLLKITSNLIITTVSSNGRMCI
jgi:hypothetical protein